MFNLISTNGKSAYGVKEFALDFETDLTSIDVNDCAPGSVAFIIENSKYYMLNSNKQWIKVTLATSGGGGSSDDVEEIRYNGGTI